MSQYNRLVPSGGGKDAMSNGTRVTVYVADDHPVFRDGVVLALRRRPEFEVVGEAEDGESAIAAARALNPDVLLLDVQLPDMDGFAVCKELELNGGPPAVVLVSSRDACDYGGLIAQSGARGFIAKDELSGSALSDLLG
jgi:two-component system, NarL family, nitrate/nitrite response regulator NarL